MHMYNLNILAELRFMEVYMYIDSCMGSYQNTLPNKC